MAVANATFDTPKNPAVRRAWIHMQLKLVGSSWTSLAKEIGVTRQAVQATAAGAPSLPIERALAAALGVTPQALFPEHWTSAGARIPKQRTLLHRAKNSRSSEPCHGKSVEAA